MATEACCNYIIITRLPAPSTCLVAQVIVSPLPSIWSPTLGVTWYNIGTVGTHAEDQKIATVTLQQTILTINCFTNEIVATFEHL